MSRYKIGIGRHRFKPQFNQKERNEELIFQGKCYWYKLDKAVPNYDKTGHEWTVDVGVDADVMKTLVKAGVPQAKFKNKGDDRGFFLSFKRNTMNKDPITKERTVPAKPVKVVGRDGKPWDMKVKVGNGSTVNVQFVINENPFNGTITKSLGLLGVQIWDHVPYEGGEREEFPVDDNGNEAWGEED